MSMPTLQFKDGNGVSQFQPAHLLTTTAGTAAAAGTYTPAVSRDTGRAIYMAGGAIVVANMAASLTDLITLIGSATKTVRLLSFWLQGVASAAEVDSITLKKHSVANTGGTKATAPSCVPLDSSDAAATAVASVYTANPTIDASALQIAAKQLALGTTPAPGELFQVNFLEWFEKGLVLRGVAQEFAVNFGGTTPGAGAALRWGMVWAEESES